MNFRPQLGSLHRRPLRFQRGKDGGLPKFRAGHVMLAVMLFVPGMMALGPLVPFDTVSARSVSGQIIVYGAKPGTLSVTDLPGQILTSFKWIGGAVPRVTDTESRSTFPQ